MTKNVEKKSIEDFPVVMKFLEVFCRRSSRTSPYLRDYIGIDLKFGVVPMHKALY